MQRAILNVVGEDAPAAPPFSEEALALEFAAKHRDDMRYVAAWGKWFIYDGRCWREDVTRAAFSRSRDICRAAGLVSNGKGKSLASAGTRAAVLSLAMDDRALAATVDQWDQDPWLLNTPEGVVDLQTGQLRAALPEDYATKLTAFSPGGGCHLWLDFLTQVTGGNAELQAYLKRVAGYCLTGLTTEHALFFLYGLGANGKSVFITTLAGILGDYARTAPMETFAASKNDRHPTELAMLRGARLVTAVETEEGHRWAESRIKSLTGGDKVSARFMRQDFFEYVPTFKLAIVGNHKPGLRAVNEAIRRRFHLVPFDVTIAKEARDLELALKLKAEGRGILAWAIEGCREWQAKGLLPPEAVLVATDAYMEAEDAVGAWIADCCDVGPEAWATSGKLFASWSSWAQGAGEHVGSQRALSGKLEDRGFKALRKDQRGFVGIALKPTEQKGVTSRLPLDRRGM